MTTDTQVVPILVEGYKGVHCSLRASLVTGYVEVTIGAATFHPTISKDKLEVLLERRCGVLVKGLGFRKRWVIPEGVTAPWDGRKAHANGVEQGDSRRVAR